MNSLFGGGMFGMGSSNSMSSILSDWSMIRSGTYKKLMKAYYAKTTDSTSKNSSTNKEKDKVTEKNVTAAENSATNLKKAADDLLKTGKTSVFAKTTKKDEDGKEVETYDTDKIYKAVDKFVKNYNALIGDTAKTINSGISNNRKSMIASTNGSESLLEDIGISINSDNTLTINEDAFKKADMSKVERMFSGNTSYGYQVSLRASLINYYAGREADTYNSSGSYNKYNSYTAGNNYNSWF